MCMDLSQQQQNETRTRDGKGKLLLKRQFFFCIFMVCVDIDKCLYVN